MFERGSGKKPEIDDEQVKEFHAKIAGGGRERHAFKRAAERGGQLFLGTKAEALGREVRRGMIAPDHPDLSIGQQCKSLSIARSSFYDTPKGESEQNLGLMRRIDEPFLETPFLGVRQMT